MAQRNEFVDNILSDKLSLIHLLDSNDAEDNKEAHILKVLEKCRKNLIGYSRLALNNHESNIVC